MRFILRSAFWLSAAYLVLAPNLDVGASASAAGEQLSKSGTDIASLIHPHSCQTIECTAGRVVTARALELLSSQPVSYPMQEALSVEAVPLPRPRPDWAS